jgi:hypothetical protein
MVGLNPLATLTLNGRSTPNNTCGLGVTVGGTTVRVAGDCSSPRQLFVIHYIISILADRRR